MPFERKSIAPPHNLEAEENVIGGVLVHAQRLAEVVPLVKPGDFYHPALRAIFEAMVDLDESSIPVDALTVAQRMRELDTFDKLHAFNDADYLTDLMAKVVTVENIAYYAKMVRETSICRRWTLRFQELAAAGYNMTSADDFLDLAESAMLELTTSRQAGGGGPRTFHAVMREFKNLLDERMARRQETGSGITGVPTGYGEVDFLLCGLQRGDHVVIAGRPGMGKSAFAMNSLVNAARVRDGDGRFMHPGLVFSLEMSQEQLAERSVAGEARVDSMKLRQGDVNTTQWESATRAMGRLAELPIRLETRGTITVAEIRSIARVWAMGLATNPTISRDAIPVVVIDYLQLVQASEREGASRENEVSEISRGLKLLAKDLHIPVVSLAQLNRGVETRADKRPLLADLRESGAIEQDADVVAFIYRDEKYHKVEPGQCPDCGPGVAEFIVRKQRMGPCMTAHLSFVDSITRFENLSERGNA